MRKRLKDIDYIEVPRFLINFNIYIYIYAIYDADMFLLFLRLGQEVASG